MVRLVQMMMSMLTAKEKINLFLLFAALLGVACLDMAGVASILPFMAVVGNPDIIETNKWLKYAYEVLAVGSVQKFVFYLGMVVLGVLFFGNCFKALTFWVRLKYDNHLFYMLARRVLATYLTRPYWFFLNRNTSEMGKNVVAEIRTVITGVLSAGIDVLSSALISVFILGLLVAVDPVIAVTIFGVLGGTYGAIFWIARRRLSVVGREQVEANAMKYKAAGEALAGIKDIKVLGREWQFLRRFSIYAERHARNNVTADLISQLPRYGLEIVAFGGILLIVLHFLGSEQGKMGRIVPLLSLYAFAGYRLLPALQQVFGGVTAVRFNLAALELVHRDLTEGKDWVASEAYLQSRESVSPMRFNEEIRLDGVTFRYPGGMEEAVRELDLLIKCNTSIGLVGATGSGKTTVVDITLGLLSPCSGRLLVDGKEVKEENVASWQLNLGYVPQHIYLSDDSIRKNVAFGVPDNEIDMSAVVQACRIANLSEFIQSELPNGYETMIGERGVRLSGGQRQRIGIARALYRDPRVLIMDEATSALDGITEEAVMDALRTLSGQKTVIIIAHRLTTVKDCDVIYLMEDGRITAHGTFEELRKSCDWFQAAARTTS